MQLRPEFPIRTSRLLLRPLTLDDLDEALTYRSRPDVCRYLPFEPMTRDVLAARLATDMARRELTDEGHAMTLGARLADTGELAGDVVLFLRSVLHRGGEVGYAFHPSFGGRGLATEAAAAVVRLGFEHLGLHRIIARLDARNTPSARLCERLGMRLEARLVRNEWFKGEWSDELDYAILGDEWPTSPGYSIAHG